MSNPNCYYCMNKIAVTNCYACSNPICFECTCVKLVHFTTIQKLKKIKRCVGCHRDNSFPHVIDM